MITLADLVMLAAVDAATEARRDCPGADDQMIARAVAVEVVRELAEYQNAAVPPVATDFWTRPELVRLADDIERGASKAVQPEGDKIDSAAEALGVPDGQGGGS
jgi:hypothetical protein